MFDTHRIVTVIALVCALAVALPALAKKKKDAAEPVPEETVNEPETEIQQDIRRLLEASGAAAAGKQVMDQMMDMFSQSNPAVPPEFWTGLREEIDMEEFVNMLIPVYEKHLSHEDIQGLIAFYESPLGRKMVATQPALMADSMVLGQEWGADLARRVMAKMGEAGY
jgi:uncharacterized protein